jgi:hypothetical protein
MTPPHPNTRQCAYTKVDGHRCGGPAIHDSDFCQHHHTLKTSIERQSFSLPALDDANAVSVAAMQIMNALILGKLSRPDAYALIQGLHLVRANLKATTLAPPADDELAQLLERAREEGRMQGRREALKQARAEREREEAERVSPDNESLAAFLLRELQTPQKDDLGRTMRDADGNTIYVDSPGAEGRTTR